MWIHDFAPSKINELAVNKTKINELLQKLENALTLLKPSILLLIGPSGCSKSTALKIICEESHIEIIEWINNFTIPIKNYNSIDNYEISESHYNKFLDFIKRANGYSLHEILNNKNKSFRKIVLVKDFPNFLIINKDKMNDFIIKFQNNSIGVPLIFILSEDQKYFSGIQNFFSPANLLKYNIECIKFNSISQTSMQKSINNIINKISLKFNFNLSKNDKDILQDMINQSNGDLKYTINSLEFFLNNKFNTNSYNQPNITKLNSIKSKKLKDKKMHIEINHRDFNIPLFKTIGRILHFKKNENLNSRNVLPEHLINVQQNNINLDVDNLFLESVLSSETLVSYLHFNYPPFLNKIYELSITSLYIADADLFLKQSFNNNFFSEYSNIIAIRGIIFSKSDDNFKGPGWCPLFKPRRIDIDILQNIEGLNSVVSFNQIASSELISQYLPYANRIKNKLNDQKEYQFINNLVCFNKSKFNQNKYVEKFDDSFNINSENFCCQHIKELNTKDVENFYEDHNDIIIDDFDE